jgi:hypothetical protein
MRLQPKSPLYLHYVNICDGDYDDGDYDYVPVSPSVSITGNSMEWLEFFHRFRHGLSLGHHFQPRAHEFSYSTRTGGELVGMWGWSFTSVRCRSSDCVELFLRLPRHSHNKKKKNSVALSPQANYTDWATATCQQNSVPAFVDRGVLRGQRGGSPTVVNFSFLDRSHYFSFK